MNVKLECANLLSTIKKNTRDAGRFNLSKYLGTSHILYNVSVPKLRILAKEWVGAHKDITKYECIELLDRLYFGDSREEKVLASMVLLRYPKYLVDLDDKHLDRWLSQLVGWEEVDSFCGGVDIWMREDVKNRAKLLAAWNKDPQIEKRRASLVVLCSSVRYEEAQFYADVSFQFIDALKSEKEGMITKAISWLLRTLIKFHREDVMRFIEKYEMSLPRVAIREATRKLETGKK